MGVDGAELVGEGAFRVDRKRALDKLSKFQLRDDMPAAWLWVRAAVASGARNFTVRRSKACLELEWDGRALEREDLGDPMALLESRRDAFPERARLTSYAMLATFRAARPTLRGIEIHSGGVVFSVSGLAADGAVRAVKTPRAGTVVRLLDDARPFLGDRFRRFLRGDWAAGTAMSGLSVVFEGAVPVLRPDGKGTLMWKGPLGLRDHPRRLDSLSFDHGGGTRGRMWVSAKHRRQALVHVHHRGVYVGEARASLSVGGVEARINIDAISLDASLARPVQDERFAAALAGLDAEAGRLLERTVAAMSERFPETGRLLRGDAALRRLWAYRVDHGAPADDLEFGFNRMIDRSKGFMGFHPAVAAGGLFFMGLVVAGKALAREMRSAARERLFRRILWDARCVRWVRAEASRQVPRRGKPGPCAALLWRAPVQFNAFGDPLTLREVEAIAVAAGGRVWHSPDRRPSGEPEELRRVVWSVGGNELRWLRERFGGQVVRRGR